MTYWQPSPAQQDARAAHPHPQPRGYALMLRTWDYAWWKPVLGILLMLAGSLVVMPLVLTPVLALGIFLEGPSSTFSARFTGALSSPTYTPAYLLWLNLSLASLTLVAMGVARVLHRLRPRWLASVRPGIRWKFLAACVGLAVVALLAALVVGSLVPQDVNGMAGHAKPLRGQLLATALVILVSTPLQALGEEYAFRGYLLTAFGSLTRSSVLAVVGSTALFAAAHGVQNVPLLLDRVAFGVVAGVLAVRVGGLEAGIAFHVLNNLLALGVAVAFGDVQASLTATSASWWILPGSAVQYGLYLVLVLLVARRMGVQRRTAPPLADDVVVER